jgi:CHAT domain-containing protein
VLKIPQLIENIPPCYQKLRLIPYRQLHRFPLEALNYQNQPMIARFSQGVSYTPSCQLWQLATSSNHQAKSLIESPQIFALQNPTQDLTYAQLEVEAILQKHFKQPNFFCLSKDEASLENLFENLERLSNSYFWHNACHSYFNFEQVLYSALCLAGSIVPDGEGDDRYYSWRNGEKIDTKKCLTLLQIFDLKLLNCFLTTISSCESGLTAINQQLEEYIGIPSALIYAGVSHIIASHWRVNDISTSILMIKFYENLFSQEITSVKVSLALNQAQMWLKNRTPVDLKNWLSTTSLTHEQQDIIKGSVDDYNDHETPFADPIHWAAFSSIS